MDIVQKAMFMLIIYPKFDMLLTYSKSEKKKTNSIENQLLKSELKLLLLRKLIQICFNKTNRFSYRY